MWACAECGWSNDNYQALIGHLGKHTEGRNPGGRPKKKVDPMDMTFSQLIDRLDTLQKENDKLKDDLHKEKGRNTRIRAALSDFMGGTNA